MLEQALEHLKKVNPESGLTFFDHGWHQGVVGILASRLKDRVHRPVICFAKGGEAASEGGVPVLRGSGRSIPGLHLRDCLDLVAKRAPGLIVRFGGHAMAAGLTIREADYAALRARVRSVRWRNCCRPRRACAPSRPTAPWRARTARSRWRTCSRARSGARDFRSRSSAIISAWSPSAWSAKSISSCAW